MAEGGSNDGQLRESLINSSDIVYDIYCEICAEYDRHLEAVGFCKTCNDYLCRDCFKAHTRNRASRNHVLQDAANMPRQKPPKPSPTSVPSTESITEKCDKHANRLAEYYCRDHRCLGCSVCMTVTHRQCDDVDQVSDLSQNVLDSPKYIRFKSTLGSLKVKSQVVVNTIKDNATRVDSYLSDVRTALITLRKKMNEAFDRFEVEIMTKSSEIHQSDILKLNDISDKGNTVLDAVNDISSDLQSLKSNNQLSQIFVKLVKLEDTVNALSTLLGEAEANNKVTPYALTASSVLLDMLDNKTLIGTLSVKRLPRTRLLQNPVAAPIVTADPDATKPKPTTPTNTTAPMQRIIDIEARFVGDINVATSSDTERCWVNGTELLSNGQMLLTDYYNCKVKVLDIHKSQITSELKVSSEPWDVTTVTKYHVAVTLPNSKRILYVEMDTEGSLKIAKTVTVSGECRAIVENGGKIIVAYRDPEKIEIMKLNGAVERVIRQPNLYQFPSHMAFGAEKGVIYISDHNGDRVLKINLAEDSGKRQRCMDLYGPTGLVVDSQGMVFVCCANSRNVHVMDQALSCGTVIVEGLEYLASLCLCSKSNKLYIGMDSNVMKVFQLA